MQPFSEALYSVAQIRQAEQFAIQAAHVRHGLKLGVHVDQARVQINRGEVEDRHRCGWLRYHSELAGKGGVAKSKFGFIGALVS